MSNSQFVKSGGLVIWLTGLSGAGKTTLAFLLKEKLEGGGARSIVLDGDELRAGINKGLGFSNEDRMENIRRAAEMAKVISANQLITICSFISPMHQQRSLAKEIIGNLYFEIYIKCPLEICEKRDIKGLYKKARHNEIKNFTGVQSAFEAPANPFLVINTGLDTPGESLEKLYTAIKPFINCPLP